MAAPSVRPGAIPGPSSHANATRPSPYSPHDSELRPGARNRLFLALRSGIDSEVEWALPRLVVGSYDHPEKFRLETWVDSVGALLAYPLKFLDELEQSMTLSWVLDNKLDAPNAVKALVASKASISESLEKKATESLLVLRNAAFVPANAKLICRQSFLAFIERYLDLTYPFLLESTLKYPELTAHLLSIVTSILPHLQSPSEFLLEALSQSLPRLLIDTRDSALITLLLPILIHAAGIANLPYIDDELIPHLLHYLTLSPPNTILDPILDLLFVLTSNNAIYSRQILASNHIGSYLRSLTPLLTLGSRPYHAAWESTPTLAGKVVRNPASDAAAAEEASRRRARERELAQKRMEPGGGGVVVPVGDRPPVLSSAIKARLYTLPEPKRSIAWMHETFVYCSTSQLLQVIFWHAYRDFFQHPSTVDQLLSASEVIKNVTVAFPGASAKIWIDEMGAQKFVIAGMGFRKGSEDDDRFSCLWRGCMNPGLKFSTPNELYQHIRSYHLLDTPVSCGWAGCHQEYTPSHLLTHLPPAKRLNIPDTITTHPSTSETLLASNKITSRQPPPLPRSVKLSFTGNLTLADQNRQPTGSPFLASLVIRNLARTLRSEMKAEEVERGEVDQREKKKHLLEERFGLPIPDTVLREEEEEEKDFIKGLDEGLAGKERRKAIEAFKGIEERILAVVEGNMNGLGRYLGEAFGW